MTNDNDPYLLFTQCHRLYVQGVRRALRERLERTYGGAWWSEGALAVLSDNQRQNVELQMEREPTLDVESRLDSAHFGRIVSRRYAAAFADSFPDARSAFAQFTRVARMRNEWAHVQEMQPAKAMSAIRAMRSVLASLRQAEALEVDRLTRDITANESKYSREDYDVDDQTITDADELGEDYALDEIASPSSDFWRQLRSHLTLDTSIVINENGVAIITVEVSNTAIWGEGTPVVSFNSVRIHASNVNRDSGSDSIGSLGPGESHQARYTCVRNALATASFSVSGNLDMGNFFHFSKPGVLPREIVSPILDEFFERFEALDIKAPFEKALDAISGVSPSMTIADLLSVRPELERIKALVGDKANGMSELFRDFQLNKRYSLGKECSEIAGYFNQVAEKIATAENAIGSINLEAIAQVTRDLEQIQLAVLRIEDAVKNMRAKPRAPSSP